jgi:hypothetical protein
MVSTTRQSHSPLPLGPPEAHKAFTVMNTIILNFFVLCFTGGHISGFFLLQCLNSSAKTHTLLIQLFAIHGQRALSSFSLSKGRMSLLEVRQQLSNVLFKLCHSGPAASTAHLFARAHVKDRAWITQNGKKCESVQRKTRDKSMMPHVFKAVNDLPVILVHHPCRRLSPDHLVKVSVGITTTTTTSTYFNQCQIQRSGPSPRLGGGAMGSTRNVKWALENNLFFFTLWPNWPK